MQWFIISQPVSFCIKTPLDQRTGRSDLKDIFCQNIIYFFIQDNRLIKAVKECGDGQDKWVKVAKHVGGGVDNNQCCKRWLQTVNPELAKCKHGTWSVKEVSTLKL